MSYVTNVILTFSCLEEGIAGWDSDGSALMATVNAWLVDQGYGAFGPEADTICGGSKHLETPLYVAAFNYFRLDAFLSMLQRVPWKAPAQVQVFVQEEDAETFTVILPCVKPVTTPSVPY